MNNICFIANKYPNKVEANALVFVQQLVWQIADLGKKCIVICPLAINLNMKYKIIPEHIKEKTEKGNYIDVYFPKFFGLGQSHYIFGKSPAPITTNLFTKSILKTIHKYNIEIETVYGHFLTPAGIAASRIGKKLNIPSFFAYGESSTWSIEQIGLNRARRDLNNINGVIAVSSKNKDLLIEHNLVDNEKIKVFPNGYRPERFYKISKDLARKKMGWDNNKFIVGFVGSFDERKGILRLEKAIDELNDCNIVFACAGKGKLIPKSRKCILAQPINNEDLIYFYNAIDVFALPTQNEGCCNAIVEAMACGCPIISSDRKFNYDILDYSNSIMIDPDNIKELSKAIEEKTELKIF